MISIVSYFSEQYKPLADLTVFGNKLKYCEENGYRCDWLMVESTAQLVAGYERMEFILQLMNLDHDLEWCWAMGCDTLIMNFIRRIEEFTDNDFYFIISHDGQCLNGDSYLVRNSDQGRALLHHFLDTRANYVEHCWADSQAMTEAAAEPKWRGLIKIVPQQGFNSYDPRPYPHQAGTFARFKEGDFLVHFPGLSLEQRLEMAKEYLPKVIYRLPQQEHTA